MSEGAEPSATSTLLCFHGTRGRVTPGRADSEATLPDVAVTGDIPAFAPQIALTILFHPDLERVGERALLGSDTKPWTARLSRMEPEFSPVTGAAGRPLDEDHVSRKPVILSLRPDGSVDLDATGTQIKVVIAKKHVTERRFLPAELRRGVVLLIAGHVVLLLHAVMPSPQSAGGERYGLIGESDGLRSVLSDVRAVADLMRPVLLRGPSGSGKELVARAIHSAGRRSSGPFVAVNLGAVPASIAAAELFGAEKGAFTGAVRRAGYFEQAQGGTLFLDEIGEAAGELQAALLRAIQDGEIQPLGADRPRKVDVRVVAATDANLEARVHDGSFRAPLLSRLAAYQIWIPPLSDRRDDIGRLLARFFEEELAGGAHGRSARTAAASGWIPAPLIAELCEHQWPGNVRQLRNVVGHLVIPSLSQPRMTMNPTALRLLHGAVGEERWRGNEYVPPERPDARGGPKRQAIDLSEAEIREALRVCRWEIDAAARHLGVARPSLYRAMERFPAIRTARDLTPDEIRAAHKAAGGDVARMAEALCVSEKALSRRVRDLGI
jgi:two-component system, NtrC family, nitrogen regulation response regulator GlnG